MMSFGQPRLVVADVAALQADELRNPLRLKRRRAARLAVGIRWKRAACQRADQVTEEAVKALRTCLASARLRGGTRDVLSSRSKRSKAHRGKLIMKTLQHIQSRKKTAPAKRRGSGWAMTDQAHLEMAGEFAGSTSSKRALGTSFNTRKDAVSRTVALVSCMSITADLARMDKLMHWIRRDAPIIDFALLSFAGDSTKANVSVTIQGSRHANSTKPTHILLEMATVVWRERGREIEVWNVEVPPIEIPKDDAENMWRCVHTTTIG